MSRLEKIIITIVFIATAYMTWLAFKAGGEQKTYDFPVNYEQKNQNIC